MVVTERFKLVLILTKCVFVNLDSIALEVTEEPTMKRNGFVAQLLNEFFCFVVPRNDNGNLIILDEAKFVGGSPVIEKKE